MWAWGNWMRRVKAIQFYLFLQLLTKKIAGLLDDLYAKKKLIGKCTGSLTIKMVKNEWQNHRGKFSQSSTVE